MKIAQSGGLVKSSDPFTLLLNFIFGLKTLVIYKWKHIYRLTHSQSFCNWNTLNYHSFKCIIDSHRSQGRLSRMYKQLEYLLLIQKLLTVCHSARMYICICVCQGSSCFLWCSHTVHSPASCPLPTPPSLFVHLLAVLVFLLLELPKMGLDGCSSLLNFYWAERRNQSSSSSTCPVAKIGVWAQQDTGDSQRGRSNSHGDKVCSND